jgi:hypothetical protein
MTSNTCGESSDTLQQHLLMAFGFPDKRCKAGVRVGKLKVDDAKGGDICGTMYSAYLEHTGAGRLTLAISNLPTSGKVRRAIKGRTRHAIPSGTYQAVQLSFSVVDTRVATELAEALYATVDEGRYRQRNWVWQCPGLAKCLERLATVLDDFVVQERKRRIVSPDLFYDYEL